MTRTPPPEGLLESLARRIVAEALGLDVTRFDDGSASRQVDALIHRPTGTVPLEVVSDEDPHYEQQWAELDRRGRVIRTDLPHSWEVSLTNRGHVRKLREILPSLLASWPWGEEHGEEELPDELRRLGVADLQQVLNPRIVGAITLTHQGWCSWDDEIELNDWVERVLARESDVASKLALHGGDEQHAFIWARPSSAWNINSILADDDEDLRIPKKGPTLPGALTHVWVASTMTRRGCLLLEHGAWRRTHWITVESD